jgi:hypothetical protein
LARGRLDLEAEERVADGASEDEARYAARRATNVDPLTALRFE